MVGLAFFAAPGAVACGADRGSGPVFGGFVHDFFFYGNIFPFLPTDVIET
jgi:hypothetical protein